MNDLYGNGVKLNEKVLDLLWKRQSMTSANIANVDTPGYKSLYMSFEDQLANRIKRSSTADGSTTQRDVARVIDHLHEQVKTDESESTQLDGNNVDMDQEEVELAKTNLEYQYMVNSISQELKRLDSAAKTF